MSSGARWIPLADRQQWRDALRGMEHGFIHLPEYSAAAARVTGHEAGLWHWRDEAGRAACPLLVRASPGGAKDVATPMGFGGFAIAGDTAGLARAWTDYWRGQGAVAAYVQLSPVHPAEAWRDALQGLEVDLAPSRECYVWDLRADPASLRAAMSATHRNLLRQWQRDDSRLCTDAGRLRAGFDRLYAGFLERRGIGGAYRYSPKAIDELAASPGVLWIGAQDAQGELEAVALFLWHGRWGEVFLVAATDAGRRHSRGLYWEGALRLRELGVEQLNLGGGVADGDALALFKQRLGAAPRQTLALRQVVDVHGFERACAAAGTTPNAGGRFPPWLAG
jgi:hypothetical protein